MSRINEIKCKIRNIKSTEKITRAMEMISTGKMRKAQEVVRSSRPYCMAIMELINNLSHNNLLKQHEFFIKRPEQNIGLLVVSSDRGLCGGLNINLFKMCRTNIINWLSNNSGLQIKVATIGEKAKKFFSRTTFEKHIKIIASLESLAQKPKIQDLIGVVQVLLQEYEQKNLDSIYIAYNQFENVMKQTPIIKQILPIVTNLVDNNSMLQTEYIFEPDASVIFDLLLTRYLESLVYQGVVENIASEHSARMVAMKNATDNAKKIMDNLQIYLNKERQAIITKEISEIIGGAVGI